MTFQAAASSQGRTFEEIVEDVLTRTGWTISSRRWREPTVEVEIDIVATDPAGAVHWIECKGSWLSPSGRNGVIRTDTAKKLVGDAALLSTIPRPPYLLVTSHLPDAGTPARRWLDIALTQGWLNGVEVIATTFHAHPRPAEPTA